jgi:hypothetical protein
MNILRMALVLFSVAATGSAWASGGPPMVTDDPGTPGDGHWEINVAALTNRTADETTNQFPLVDINYGVGERIQLKFEMPWLWENDADSSPNRNGAGDGLAGVKWRFYDAGEDGWQISTYPQVEFNTHLSSSPHDDMTENGTSYLLPFEFVHGFGDWDINVELGRWFRPAPRSDTWIAGFVLTHEVRKGFEVLAEIHDEATVHQTWDELLFDFGTRLDFSEHYTFLFSIGRDLHNTLNATNTLSTYLGLQLRY